MGWTARVKEMLSRGGAAVEPAPAPAAPSSEVDWGTLRRRDPFCAHWGTTRGRVIARVYIDRFVAQHADLLAGDVAEMQKPLYCDVFAAEGATVHIVDIDAGNPDVTLVCDLCQPGSLPEAAFDAFILTQTLQYLEDPHEGLRNVWRSVRPGGAIIISVPIIDRRDPHFGPRADRWRFTEPGLATLIDRALPPEAHVSTAEYGTLPAAVAYLLGLPAEELDEDDMFPSDERFPVTACALVRKPADFAG